MGRQSPDGTGGGKRPANNPDPSTIACHRVVSRRGAVSARFAFGGAGRQRELLEAEGVVFDPNGRIDLEKYSFRP